MQVLNKREDPDPKEIISDTDGPNFNESDGSETLVKSKINFFKQTIFLPLFFDRRFSAVWQRTISDMIKTKF
jgi:hypothetical protein